MAEKQKPMLPTQKEKKRYIAYRLHSQKALSRSAGHSLVDSLNSTLGVFDAAAAGVMTITYDAQDQLGVIRCSNASVRKVRAAMLLTSALNSSPVMVQPLVTSGILKKCKNVR